MAIINCSECGKSVSDSASTCPGCGKPLRGPFFGVGGGTGCIIFVIVVFIIIWLGTLWNRH